MGLWAIFTGLWSTQEKLRIKEEKHVRPTTEHVPRLAEHEVTSFENHIQSSDGSKVESKVDTLFDESAQDAESSQEEEESCPHEAIGAIVPCLQTLPVVQPVISSSTQEFKEEFHEFVDDLMSEDESTDGIVEDQSSSDHGSGDEQSDSQDILSNTPEVSETTEQQEPPEKFEESELCNVWINYEASSDTITLNIEPSTPGKPTVHVTDVLLSQSNTFESKPGTPDLFKGQGFPQEEETFGSIAGKIINEISQNLLMNHDLDDQMDTHDQERKIEEQETPELDTEYPPEIHQDLTQVTSSDFIEAASPGQDSGFSETFFQDSSDDGTSFWDSGSVTDQEIPLDDFFDKSQDIEGESDYEMDMSFDQDIKGSVVRMDVSEINPIRYLCLERGHKMNQVTPVSYMAPRATLSCKILKTNRTKVCTDLSFKGHSNRVNRAHETRLRFKKEKNQKLQERLQSKKKIKPCIYLPSDDESDVLKDL